MGVFSKLFGKQRKSRSTRCCQQFVTDNTRRLQFETMEPRRVLSADPLVVGAVYYESDNGADVVPDIIEVTFEGGTNQTRLADLTIQLNPILHFDTLPGPGQPPEAFGFQVDEALSVGITASDILGFTVADAGNSLTMNIDDFRAGDRLVFTIDVDHIVGLNGDPIASGAEFELSTLIANFQDPNFDILRLQPEIDPNDPVVRAGLTGTEDGIFWDYFDGNFSGTGIENNLREDDFLDTNGEGQRDRTAGVVIGFELEPFPVTICGTVFHDRNMNLAQEMGEEGIDNVTLRLLKKDANGDFQAVLDSAGNEVTTLTNTDGEYCFGVNDGLVLLPGTYSVVEQQPNEFLISVGAIPGTVEPGSGSSVGTVDGTNKIGEIEIPLGNTDAVNYDFAEANPIEINGNVHLSDENGNCFGPGTPSHRPIEGAAVYLISDQGIVLQTETDANGDYSFSSADMPLGTFLLPGSYTIIEVTPDGLFDGSDSIGTVNGGTVGQVPITDLTQIQQADGTVILVSDVVAADELGRLDFVTTIQLASNDSGINYDFCESEPASLSGHVYEDLNDNGIREPGEAPISGVTITLFDGAGNFVRDTQTNNNGFYRFDDLTADGYTVVETHPQDYFDGKDAAGTINGATVGSAVRAPDADGFVRDNDLISEINLGFGQDSINNDFGELPPASLSGFVYHDLDNDGVFDSNESPIAGVPMELRLSFANGTSGVLLTSDHVIDPSLLDSAGRYIVSTDANGFYEFTGIRGGVIENINGSLFGNYAVYQNAQPTEFEDGLDTAGSTGGLADNANHDSQPANSPFAQGFITTHTANGARTGDLLFLIPVGVNQSSIQNNFGEILDDPPPPPPPPPPELPPDPLNLTPLPPPGLPPIRQVILPPFLPLAANRPMETFGGGGGYTWHLSVIDAGHPRGDTDVENLDDGVWYTASYLNPNDWEASNLHKGRWQLKVVAGIDGEELDHVEREFFFGIHGGTPVTGDFNGDGVDEVGVFYRGEWFIDLNGNGRWDENDLWARLGSEADQPVTGDWNGDGKDDIGIFGPIWQGDPRAIKHEPGLPDAANDPKDKPKNVPPKPHEATDGYRELRLTKDGKPRAELIDHVFRYGRPNDVPIAGDWNGDGISTIGVFRDGKWLLDMDGDGHWSTGDVVARFGQAGDVPVVGDFNGDGVSDVGIYRNGTWMIDINGNRELDAHDKVFAMGGADDLPVVGDWNGDGIDDPGIYHAAEQVEQARR